MDELEAYAKTLANRTQCHASKGSEASPVSSKRKRGTRILRDDNGSEAENSTPEDSPKRVRSLSSSEKDFTDGKENKSSARMEVAGRKDGASSASKACSQKKVAMQECVMELAGSDPAPENMSVAARKALFERAASRSSSTLPLPRKPPPKPVLKQVFSTVKLAEADERRPFSSSMSVQIGGNGVTNVESTNRACVESCTPPTARNESRQPRAPTPKRIIRTELVIKRVECNGSHSGSSGTGSPASPHFEYLKSCFDPNRAKTTEASGGGLLQDTTAKTGSSGSAASPIQDDTSRGAGFGDVEETRKMEVSESASTSTLEEEHKPVVQDEQEPSKSSGKSISVSADRDCNISLPMNASFCGRMSLESGPMDVVKPGEPEEEPDETNSSVEDEDEVFEPKRQPVAVTNSIVKRAIASLTSNKSVCEDAESPAHRDAEERPRYSLMSAEEAEVFDEMDEILNNALDGECSDNGSYVDQASCRSPAVSTVKTEGRVWFADSSDTQFPSPRKQGVEAKSLPHTISFYRRQQQSLTPKKMATRSSTPVEYPTPTGVQFEVPLGDRIRALQDEVMAQQTIISQASQALNLCQASAEFLGSAEQTEGERLLLIATQRRLACLNEIQRLKQLGHVSEGGQLKGNFKIMKIAFPLKPSFVGDERESKHAEEAYHFLCLVQHGPRVVPSQMVSAEELGDAASLTFDKEVDFCDIAEDFQVVVDVYALKTKKAAIPHDKKYHIKKETLRLKLPTKGKRNDAKLFLSPAISSPGGPDAVRTSSFQLLGSIVINCDTCSEKMLPLTKVATGSPLEGTVTVTMQLCADHKIEHKGFLTLFQDIGGLGAWTRLWCLLKGSSIVFWKYPDEEEKPPLGSVDLRQCINKDVSLLSRMECGRPNTFRLILVRPLEGNEVDTITVKKHSTVVSITHLFSADSKEEGGVWCKKVNTVLSCIRKWDTDAFRALNEACS